MNKLFVFQENHKDQYRKELQSAYSICKNDSSKINVDKLSIDYLVENVIEVVVSNGLPKEWYYIFKGLNIVAITIDNIESYYNFADIVVDHQSKDSNKYFTGEEYSIRKNADFDFNEIAGLMSKQEWDSNFWGFPVAYLSSRYLTNNIMLKIEALIRKEKIKLIEYLCNCHDSRSVKIAEKNGFHFTDIRLLFEKHLNGKYEPDELLENITFGRAAKSHISEIKKISENLYLNSRYFFDENFSSDKANEFYQSWVSKAVLGEYDDECYCLFDKKKPIGFCTIKYNPSNTASIGLFGLAKDYQRQGLGKSLLHLTLNSLRDKEVKVVYVVTQGRNYQAQRFYQNSGFLTKSTELWYHRWL